MINRVKSGIPGLDKLISEGFVKNSTNLITGGTGTGKTTFCIQFLLEGLKNKEGGIYVSMEEDPEKIRKNMRTFNWDLDEYEENGMLKMIYQNPFEVSDISSTLGQSIRKIKAKRVVIDPISLMGLYIKDKAVIRKKLFQLTKTVSESSVTTLITSEILEKSGSLSRGGLIEFIVDGVIILHFVGIGNQSFGNIQIRKMRETCHARGWFPLEISGKGLRVKKEEVSTLLK